MFPPVNPNVNLVINQLSQVWGPFPYHLVMEPFAMENGPFGFMIYIYIHTDYIDALYYLHYYALLYFQQFSTCWNFHSCVKFTRERMGNTIQQRPSFGVQFVAC